MKQTLVALMLCLPLTATGTEAPGEDKPVLPQRQSAGDLLNACASSALTETGRLRRRFCSGYLSGAEETMRLLGHRLESAPGICAPPETSARELIDAYSQYALRHRDRLRVPAVILAVEALEHAYPCPPRR